ncbi:MAG TPA: hypothetical protein VD834_16555 [Blastococcus sp.]|nr:hypothetical protein [Nocardioides sp.]HYH26958.1 hypothetical protein [Blastococcus sp.]
MASTAEGRRLTEAHRQAQQDVRDDFLAEFLALWALLDTARLDDTGPGWVRAVARLIVAYRLLSAEIATQYFWEFRAAEAPDTVARPRIPGGITDTTSRPPSAPPPAGPSTGRPPRTASVPPRSRAARIRQAERELDRALRGSGVRWDVDESAFELPERRATIEIPDIDWSETDRKIEVDLNIAGPIGQKSKIGKGRRPEEARDVSLVEATGTATRHVLTGGRQSLLTLVQGDMQAIGWVRVTDGDPCYFCAMLASRGPVYKKGSFAASDPRFTGPGTVKVHDHCACTLEAVYSRNTLWPGRAQEFHRLWREHIYRRYSGAEARRQWRRIYTELQREGRLSA